MAMSKDGYLASCSNGVTVELAHDGKDQADVAFCTIKTREDCLL